MQLMDGFWALTRTPECQEFRKALLSSSWVCLEVHENNLMKLNTAALQVKTLAEFLFNLLSSILIVLKCFPIISSKRPLTSLQDAEEINNLICSSICENKL